MPLTALGPRFQKLLPKDGNLVCVSKLIWVVLSTTGLLFDGSAPTVIDSRGAAPWTPQKRARAALL